MAVETNRGKVVARLQREGWEYRHGGDHDIFYHPTKRLLVAVPRHRALSMGVARNIAKKAGWT